MGKDGEDLPVLGHRKGVGIGCDSNSGSTVAPDQGMAVSSPSLLAIACS